MRMPHPAAALPFHASGLRAPSDGAMSLIVSAMLAGLLVAAGGPGIILAAAVMACSLFRTRRGNGRRGRQT